MLRTSSRLLLAALFITSALGGLGASTASAQASVSVLGLTSLEGDDEFARNFTGALRHAASQVEGWTVSDRDVALTQMELTHDCSSSDAACMTEIARTLGSSRVIYGTIQRAAIGTRYEFQITMFLFNAETGSVEERVTQTVSSSDTDIDALRTPARNMVRALSAATSPGTIRVTGTPDAEVQIDGEVVGRIDSTGTYVSDSVAPGSHVVRVGGAEQTATVAGDEAVLAFAVEESGGGGGGGGSVSPLVIIGGILTAVGVGALVVSFWSMGEIQAVNDSPGWVAFAGPPGMPTTIVQQDALGSDICNYPATAELQNACRYAGTMEVLQYVFLATGVVAAGAGVGLMVAGLGESSSTTDSAGLRLRFSPSASPQHAYLGATLEF